MTIVAPQTDVLEDVAWLQRFARWLAHDASEADDLVQETMLHAWRAPPPDSDAPARPWLRSVLHNRFRMRRRADARRQQREQHAPAAAGSDAPDQHHARLQVLEILLQELRALPDQDRTIIVRRFFDDESAADIGRALQLPSATVRSRIHRALQRLRASLDRRYGSRATWGAAVFAFPPAGSATTSSATGTSTMSLTAKALVLTATATAGIAGWVVVQPEVQPADATPATPFPTESAEDTPAAGPTEARWQRRRTHILDALPDPMPEEIDAARLGDKARHEQFRDLVRGCMDDLGAGHTGALTVSMHEVGAPDIGTIIDSVEIVHTNFDEPEALECLVQSMYSFEGEAPQAAFSRTVNRTISLGKPEKADAKLAQTVGYIVGAHAGEVRFCETKSETAVQGIASLTMTFGDNGRVSESSATSTDSIPEPVLACIDAAVKRWAFPKTLWGEHVVHPITLPVPGRPPG